ncbi:MAG: hypothetical protein Q7K43_05630, partial [Candidatus Woesearchaeota archaeon]|nr:hypothetical protein [Candidatus Woesearchaeota archaeon]
MSLETKVTSKRRNWKRFSLKALLAGIAVLASPFLPVKTYDGKPWRFPVWGSRNTAACGRYVIQ